MVLSAISIDLSDPAIIFLGIMSLMLVLASISSIVFSKLRLPAIIGYLAAGIIITNVFGMPDGLAGTIINVLSDIGLVLLMFAIGLELNIKRLKQSGGFTIMVAAVQLPLMMLAGYIAGSILGFNLVESLVLGAVIAGSSTAVCTAVLRANKKITKETADTVILVTVMEDIGQVIILTMLYPLFEGISPSATDTIGLTVGIVIFMIASIAIGLLLVPRLLNWVGSRFSREILLITALGLCFGLALLSEQIGLSMAIGAFLMGLIVSQSEFSHTIERDVEPMKVTFMAIFFMDVGMQIELANLGSSILMAGYIYVIFFIAKTVTVAFAYFIGNKSAKVTFVSAASLLVMGEFAFVIAKAALDANAVSIEFYTAVIFSSLISMVLLPILASKSPDAYDSIVKHTPKAVISGFEKLETSRSNFYSRIVFSQKSVKRVRNRMTIVYIGVFAIIVIEMLFWLYGSLLSGFIGDSLGVTQRVSDIITLLINLGVIITPTAAIVVSLKVVDRMLIEGGKRKRGYHLEEDPDARSAYSRLISISNILLILIIDFIILLIVPNPLHLIDHLLIILSGLAILLVIYFLKYARKK